MEVLRSARVIGVPTTDKSSANVDESEEKGSGPALRDPRASTGELPSSYGEARVVLLPVHPHLGHVYWDISPGDLEKAESARAVLRFHDLTGVVLDQMNAPESFDVEIELEARNWYVQLPTPERSYRVDLGFRTQDGRFDSIARSNTAETPRSGPSMKREDRYLLVTGDYEQVKLLPPEGPDGPASQQAMQKKGSRPSETVED
ncbi:MAG: DUF4912 domain-containing protein, partial [Candidatus Methylomirabilales bacterium]